ncbi:MAG: diguanylate cyclase [Thermodesulfobacteriota bacterium]
MSRYPVLLVEDSRSLALFVRRKLEAALPVVVTWAQDYREAVAHLASGRDFTLGILDLTLPDAPQGQIVDLAATRGLPAIVFAGQFDERLREELWAKRVVDYVLKESPETIDLLVGLVRRLLRNREIKVLVVDDSRGARQELQELLAIHGYQVFTASSGQEALAVAAQEPDLRLVLADYAMPEPNGVELTRRLRARYSKDQLAIIGLSARADRHLSAMFLKNGANDFVHKPFLAEELYCRVSQNIELIEHIAAIQESSNRDFLTGLYNRRYLFELGENLLASALRGHITLTVAMLDIDFFKRINDTHGHDVGDMVLKHLAGILAKRFRATDVVSRYGGEEFCLLAVNMDRAAVPRVFAEVRDRIAASTLEAGGRTVKVTVSIGVSTVIGSSLEEMIRQADAMLYAAKAAGRDRVVVDEPEPADLGGPEATTSDRLMRREEAHGQNSRGG